jgi:hypothetical protein
MLQQRLLLGWKKYVNIMRRLHEDEAWREGRAESPAALLEFELLCASAHEPAAG